MLLSPYPDLSSDSTKLLFFALAIVVLFLLMRYVQKRNDRAADSSHAFGTDQDLAPSGDFQSPLAIHPAMRFEQIELRSFYMHEFDVMTGPPDPFEFVDELTAEVEHLATGERSKWEFTIGSPAGFARLLEHKGWESFYSPEIFVIRKYELEMVREMVVDHITTVLNSGRQGPPDTAKPRPADPPLP